jgi:hypothetical protein
MREALPAAGAWTREESPTVAAHAMIVLDLPGLIPRYKYDHRIECQSLSARGLV